MTDDLVMRLRSRAGVYDSHGWHAEVEIEAASRIEELERQLLAANKHIKELEDEIENLEYEMCELENNP